MARHRNALRIKDLQRDVVCSGRRIGVKQIAEGVAAAETVAGDVQRRVRVGWHIDAHHVGV